MISSEYFDLITGKFEAKTMNAAVPDFAYSPLNRAGLLYSPILDQIWVKAGKPKPNWPENKNFAVCLTHDVDAVSATNPAQNMRSMSKLIKSLSDRPIGESLRWFLIHKMQALKGLFGGKEIYCQFEDWMDLEKEFGARSTFYFAPERVLQPHTTDCMYRFDQSLRFRGGRSTVSELMRTMDTEGWEIGLHPSWHAHANLDEMVFQKEQIEQEIGHSITSVRQHFLKYDKVHTHSVQEKAGFRYDSTLGYNDNVGFRRGTSYPFNCGVEGELLQIPLVAQDGALLLGEKGMRLDPDEALKYIRLLLDNVMEVGGVLTLSWHPHTKMMPGFWELYKQTLEMVAAEDPWFGTVSEVGSWWNENVNVDLIEFTSQLIGDK